MPGDLVADPMYWYLFAFISASWFVFAFAFLLRRRAPKAAKRVHNNESIWGILLMGVGMALVWWIRRPVGSAFIPASLPASYLSDCLACLLMVGAILLILAAVKTLGKQWNVRAMVVEDHALVTYGPYALVRHPIYSGMFGMMIATGLANSQWYSVVMAGVFA
ncbi:MAG TPA: hypothetical protein DCZ69_06155, partial [Syntrophobacteraceae bacterium]|nr:hypothetical protein [Syntrophobacteraceae bacterium]